MTQELVIDLNSWIIQDGNYGDFSRGENSAFAIEFYGALLGPSARSATDCTPLPDGVYRVCAQVVFASPEVWVIDLGVLAYWEKKPPEFAKVGSWVEGDIAFGIDPFFFKEYLHKKEAMPDLVHDWQIEKIELNTAPWIETRNERGGIVLTRDEESIRWTEVEKTDAWNDDGGRGAYRLSIKREE